MDKAYIKMLRVTSITDENDPEAVGVAARHMTVENLGIAYFYAQTKRIMSDFPERMVRR